MSHIIYLRLSFHGRNGARGYWQCQWTVVICGEGCHGGRYDWNLQLDLSELVCMCAHVITSYWNVWVPAVRLLQLNQY